MLNGINERGLSKHQKVKVADKPDCLIVHAGKNDIANGVNSLNCANKIIEKVKQISPKAKVVFSSLITKKDKKDLDKKVAEVNSRLKDFCAPKKYRFYC